MQSSFLILKTLEDGSLYRADSATTPQDARERVEALAGFWPSIYIICNEITGKVGTGILGLMRTLFSLETGSFRVVSSAPKLRKKKGR
jgi:hypothetical protein